MAESSDFGIVNNVANYQDVWVVCVDGVRWDISRYSTKYRGKQIKRYPTLDDIHKKNSYKNYYQSFPN